MSFFKWKKNNEEQHCACCSKSQTDQPQNTIKNPSKHTLQVMGSGCKNCHTLFENTLNATQNLGINIHVEYVTDLETIMRSGVMSMPALILDQQVISTGKVLKTSEIEKILQKLL